MFYFEFEQSEIKINYYDSTLILVDFSYIIAKVVPDGFMDQFR